MQNDLNLDNQLQIGDLVGDTKRIVLACTKLGDRIPGDTYARWVAICTKAGEYHPYVVWDVVARPEGFYASSGDYTHTLKEAVKYYINRGGKVDEQQ